MGRTASIIAAEVIEPTGEARVPGGKVPVWPFLAINPGLSDVTWKMGVVVPQGCWRTKEVAVCKAFEPHLAQ